MPQLIRKNNACLDAVKGIACFFVVTIHCGFPGGIGHAFRCTAEFAVPFFFMVSGYFVYHSDPCVVRQRLPDKLAHIGKLFLLSEGLNLLFHTVLSPNTVLDYLRQTFTARNILRLFFLQVPFIGDVSWFLAALILCYILIFGVSKNDLWHHSIYFAVIGLSIRFFITDILPNMGVAVDSGWILNGWLSGFPFFSLGAWLHCRSEQNNRRTVSDKVLLLLLFFSFCILTGKYLATRSGSVIWEYLAPILIFVLCIRHPDIPYAPLRLAAQVGKRYSFGIYILHPIVRDLYRMVIPNYSEIFFVSWTFPIVIFFLCILIIYIVQQLRCLLH